MKYKNKYSNKKSNHNKKPMEEVIETCKFGMKLQNFGVKEN